MRHIGFIINQNLFNMTDIRDIIAFSSNGEKILGVVIEHYTNPLDDFYIVYADYALHKSHNPEKDAEVVIDNIIIPSCDAALAEYRLKRQHLRDMNKHRKDLETLINALSENIDVKNLLKNDDL